ncbi:AAA family ATPase [Acinetobacter nosocomialis]|uniref:AAA family ATPase n=1 Tax=Acinetobacter nosocomialis TaxID=106654 RepID=UPI00148F22E3|nr:AAA family ATPase [Acinetobacter nosocomialis]
MFWNKLIISYLEECKEFLNLFKKIKLIYLPTYRMVESSISSFSSDEHFYMDQSNAEEFFRDNDEIKFGTRDIEIIWEKLSNKIRTSTTEGFLKMSATLLKNIINSRNITINDINNLNKNKETINKVVSRLDRDIFLEDDREKIKEFVNKKFIKIDENLALFYILENMVNIYNQHKDIDEAIESYCKVINCFFINKKVVFNELSSEIYVEKNNNKKIGIEKLSSGEKQILLIFTKLYLNDLEDKDSTENKYWIIYDEPEISLSIEWQEILLNKILESNKCEFLLSATHSPFIFNKNLKKYTSDLALEVSESNHE